VPSTYQPKDKTHLYVRFKVNGRWRSAATPFLPGQEEAALAHAKRLEEGGVDLGGAGTVREWAIKWLKGRGKSHDVDESILRLHVLPHIGTMTVPEVRPLHILSIVHALQAAGKAPKTIWNVNGVMQALFRDARLLDMRPDTPCILNSTHLGKLRDKDLGWRAQAVFTRDELVELITDERLPFHRRMLWALLGLGMLRDGEACGLRWRNVDLDATPLGRLTIVASYNEDTTKTEAERYMPIHLDLRVIFRAWKKFGWAQEHGRQPTAEDLVMPAPKPQNRGRRKNQGEMLDKDWVWKRLQWDLETLGLRPRRVHDLRRTGISFAIEDGADPLILKRGTHAPPKDIMNLYTTVAWEKLCEEVNKLSLDNKPQKRFGPQPANKPARNPSSVRAAPRISRRDG
jgi:integrase